MAKQTKIYKTEQFKKFQQLATRPAKMIVDKIRPLTKKIDSVKDWEAIINDNIVPFLANPLTKQTGTYNDKKSLKEFVEVCKKEGFMTLSKSTDGVGREFAFCMKYNKRQKSVAFIIKKTKIGILNEDGTDAGGYLSETTEIATVNVMIPSISTVENNQWFQKALWDAHFKVSCEFNAIVNRTCLCEYRKEIPFGEHDGEFYQPCVHKKAINSPVCFAHLHEGCVNCP